VGLLYWKDIVRVATAHQEQETLEGNDLQKLLAKIKVPETI
jgi:hypothetical protein